MSQYVYPYQAQQDTAKLVNDYMAKLTQQLTGQSTQPQSQSVAQVPTFHCQPVKNLQEVEETKWYNSTPFVGITEDGQYIGIRRWDGAIPAATTEYFKRIKPEELPQAPRPITQNELVELLPDILAQYVPSLLSQMGVTTNGCESNAAAGTDVDGELPTTTTEPKRTMGKKSGEAGGDK